MEQEEVKKSKKKSLFLIGGVTTAILVAGIASVVYFSKSETKLPFNGSGLSGYVIGEGVEPGLTEEEIQELLDKQVNESQIAFSIYSEPVFNGKVGKIMFVNPMYNAHDIDLAVFLDGKEIIKTGKISPNQYIEDIELIGNALKKGEYVGTGVITAYNRETGEVVGQANVEIDITVE